MSNNNCGNELVNIIAKGLKEWKYLKKFKLNLSNNRSNGDCCEILANALKEWEQLNEFSLSLKNTKFSSKECEILSKGFKKWEKLTKFEIDIDGKDDPTSIGEGIQAWPELREMSLSLMGTTHKKSN